jgi:hypothetical protein
VFPGAGPLLAAGPACGGLHDGHPVGAGPEHPRAAGHGGRGGARAGCPPRSTHAHPANAAAGKP